MRSPVFLIVFLLLLASPLVAGAQQQATITVTAPIEGALVFVDHTLVGKAPLNATVEPGHHEVRVSAGEDYVPFVGEVDVAAGATVSVTAVLAPTAPALYRDALTAYKAGRFDEAGRLFEQAAGATGKRPADIPFYLGLLAERAQDTAAAQRWFLTWLNVSATSASGQYHLGRARQALHQDSLAATAYKNAILSAVSDAAAIIAGAGAPTSANIARLQALARAPGAQAAVASLQLAYLLELKGSIAEARDRYRALFEALASTHHIALDVPLPEGLPFELPRPSLPNPPAAPANTLYVTGDNVAAVGSAWRTYAAGHKSMAGPALVSPPSHHWITLQARAFDSASQDDINAACQGLSAALHTDVLFLAITKDGRAWYFYWNDGQKLDQYCSNPGHPGELDYKILRSWSGRPEVMARLCRGKPLSSKSAAPSMTDLNAILYFYYPELKQTKPASYRTPGTFMKTLAGILGLDNLPSRFANRTGVFRPL